MNGVIEIVVKIAMMKIIKMQSDSLLTEEFKYNENGNLVCAKCGSSNISIHSKMFLTYYQCNDCGNEEQFWRNSI